VFTSDHGEQLGDHFLFGKCGYFDQSFHIPLIVRDPDRGAAAARGRPVDAFTENVDIMPTILDWLGREVPRQCDGASLVPFCRGERPADWRCEAHWEYDFRDVVAAHPESHLGLEMDECTLNVIRGRRYKYVHFTAMAPLFFDLERDSGEMTNLAQDPAYAPKVLAHAQKMLSWRMHHDERVLTGIALTPDGLVERRPARRRFSRGGAEPAD
jgi:arylsulfatase A-like enzyme